LLLSGVVDAYRHCSPESVWKGRIRLASAFHSADSVAGRWLQPIAAPLKFFELRRRRSGNQTSAVALKKKLQRRTAPDAPDKD
jgi:hypothetical protein